MEGRRQFIPREESDQELTESELKADAKDGASRFLKRAAIAGLISAAMLNPEFAQAQELSSPIEKRKIEEVGRQFSDERHCQLLVELVAEQWPELRPILAEAMVREVDPSKVGKFGESEYYVYLPKYHVVLSVRYNNAEHELRSDSREEKTKNMDEGIQEFGTDLIIGLGKNGLIELQNDPNGKINIIPHYRGQSGGKTTPKPEAR